MGIEPTEDASQRPPPVLKTGPRTSQGRATAAEGISFPSVDQRKVSCSVTMAQTRLLDVGIFAPLIGAARSPHEHKGESIWVSPAS